MCLCALLSIQIGFTQASQRQYATPQAADRFIRFVCNRFYVADYVTELKEQEDTHSVTCCSLWQLCGSMWYQAIPMHVCMNWDRWWDQMLKLFTFSICFRPEIFSCLSSYVMLLDELKFIFVSFLQKLSDRSSQPLPSGKLLSQSYILSRSTLWVDCLESIVLSVISCL